MLLPDISVFWKKSTLINFVLLPISYLYYFSFKLSKLFRKAKHVNSKVICIGNITVGGAGKTPIAIAVAECMKKFGYKVAFISRGYGGSLSVVGAVVKVDPDKHSHKEVGDEPMLLASIAPTYICKDRYLAAKKAEHNGAEVIIMDDGLQNNSLYKDLSILVIDKNYGLGNELILPAGPLRESLASGLKKVDMICISYANLSTKPLVIKATCPIFDSDIKVNNIKSFKGKRYIALVGIGLPEKFFNTLELLKIKIIKKFIFPDHYRYNTKDLAIPIAVAEREKCKIITTEKDLIRMPNDLRHYFKVIAIKAILPSKMEEEIKERLGFENKSFY